MIKLHSVSNVALFVGILLLFAIQFDKYTYQGYHENIGKENIEIIESELSSKVFTIICHGYAGSKEMMRQLAFDISNAGSNAVIFDFIGHGSNSQKLVNNPTELSGTTQQLVDQLIGIINFLKTKYGSEIKINLIGHSMASDIVIRASENQNITSIAAISPYSTKVTSNFPQDLLLISGQFERHLRKHSLKFSQLVDPDADENIEYSNGNIRRKASYSKNTGHVSVIYSPYTSREIIEWFDLTNYERSIWATHIIWILLGLTIISYGLSRLQFSKAKYVEKQRLSSIRLTIVSVTSLAIAIFSGLLDYQPFSIFGFASIAAYFGLNGLAILILCKETRHNSENFDFYSFLKLVMAFSFLTILINQFIGSYSISSHRLYAFLIMIFPITIFCVAIENLIAISSAALAVFIRIMPIIGFSILLAIFPEKYGVMFTTVPIYIFYFLVFGYIGKFQRKQIGSYTTGATNGIFLTFAFAATNPIFSV